MHIADEYRAVKGSANDKLVGLCAECRSDCRTSISCAGRLTPKEAVSLDAILFKRCVVDGWATSRKGLIACVCGAVRSPSLDFPRPHFVTSCAIASNSGLSAAYNAR
jgi:hypothetical protein